MFKINANNKVARIAVLLLTLFGVLFFIIIIKSINPPSLILIILSLFFILLISIVLKFYFFDWDILVGNNKMIVENFFDGYSFEKGVTFGIKHFGFLSIFYSVYQLNINNKKFWFIYRRNSFLIFNPNSITSEIVEKIDRNIEKHLQ